MNIETVLCSLIIVTFILVCASAIFLLCIEEAFKNRVAKYIAIATWIMTFFIVCATVSAAKDFTKLADVKFEDCEIISTESLENYRPYSFRLKYDNKSEAEVDEIYIEDSDKYEATLVQYRAYDGIQYLNKYRLELKKKEK